MRAPEIVADRMKGWVFLRLFFAASLDRPRCDTSMVPTRVIWLFSPQPLRW